MATALPYPTDQTGAGTKTKTWVLRLFPSLTDFAFLLPIWFLFALLKGSSTLLADGDTGWHIRAGDWILQHGQVPHQDIFSFTKAGQPWFAWEWGWDVLASLIHTRWGLSGLVFVNAILIGLIGAWLYRLVRSHSVNHFVAFGISSAAMIASSIHWLARPHLLSWLFVLLFLDVIDRYERAPGKQLWCLPPAMLLWTNLHGSFFIGISFLVTYAVVGFAQRALSDEGEVCLTKPITYSICAAACGVLTFVNPYGWHLHQHLFTYLCDSQQLNGISEFSSVDFHGDARVRLYEIFVVIAPCAAFWCIQRGRWTQAVLLLLWTHLSLCIVRNVPVFLLITATPTAAFLHHITTHLNETRLREHVRRWVAWVGNPGSEFSALERVPRLHICSASGIVLLGGFLGLLSSNTGLAATFDPQDFPTKAVSLIRSDPDARVFTHDQWGDYLIYRLYPHMRVFVDGRSDFYGTAFAKGCVDTRNARYNWQAELSKYAVNTVLVKTTDPLAAVLKLSSGWLPIFDDGKALVFRLRTTVSSGLCTGRKTCNLNCLQVTS
jgi:hypothetical protein